MMNRTFIFLLNLLLLLFCANGGIATERVDDCSISSLNEMSFIISSSNENWVFDETEVIEFTISSEKALEKDIPFNLICKVTTDDYQFIDSLNYRFNGKNGEKMNQSVQFTSFAPGFYRITVYAENDNIRSAKKQFNIGVSPEKIISKPDERDDFESFWNLTRAELDKIAPQYKMSLLKEQSSELKDMYHVEMYSFDNVKIEGYYTVPKKKGKHPVIVAYMGYGSEPYFPDVNGMPEFCEFVLSVRGQGIQKATNTYGQWFTYGLQKKETYYYRGAFMDLIRALDFVSSRPEVDKDKIVAEGGSQGGAFTMIACALDNRIKAAAPYIPFLSDYRDYFRISLWPRELIDIYLQQNPDENWKNVYEVLSYFDVKNHAGNITCPIIMGVGLQDEVCPPHINFSGYNLIKSSKEHYIYRDHGHGVGDSWWKIRADFFRSQLDLK